METPAIERGWSYPASWAALVGFWSFAASSATYREPQDPEAAYGIAITDLEFRGGVLGVTITLDKPEAVGRLVFGRDPQTVRTTRRVSASVVRPIYWMSSCAVVVGCRLRPTEQPRTSTRGRAYDVEVYLYGQLVWIEVDDVEVLRVQLPHPLPGHQIAAIASSSGEIRFADLHVPPADARSVRRDAVRATI